MKQKLGRKLLSFLLTLAMVVGLVPGMSLTAYADNNETLLTTITPTGETTYSETTSGVVTVSHDNDFYMDPYGWVWSQNGGTLTVSACEGYTITKCIFKQSDYKSPFTVSGAPVELHFVFDEYHCICQENPDFDGVSSIEVYGYASKAAQTITAEDVTVTYGDTGKAVSASVTDPKTGGGTISYAVKSGSEEYIGVDASTGALTIKKVPADGIAYVAVTAAETDTHDVATKDVAVIVSKADPTSTVGQLSAFRGQTLADVALPTADNGTWSWVDDTATTLNELGTTTHFAKFTPNDTNNYNTLENVPVQIEVAEKPVAVPAAVTANNRTYDGTEKPLVTVTGEATGGEMRYALGTKDAATEPYATSIPAKTEAGTYHVWYKVVGDENHSDSEPACVPVTIAEEKKDDPKPTPEPEPAAGIVPVARGHVQNVGNVNGEASGKGVKVGTEGRSLRLENFALDLPKDTEGGIEYRGHIQNVGWGEWVAGDKACGTTGQSLRLEAVQVRLTGKLADTHDVWYRVHAQNFGTLGWAKGGQAAGTAGQALRVESLEVQVLPKGETPAGYEEGKASYVGAATANVHVQDAGWTGSQSALEFGTTGQGRRLEAVRVTVPGLPVDGGVSYEVHAQDKGWMPAVTNGALAGTEGQSKRLEAVRISLTGDAAKEGNFSVWYRVHSQDYGWLGWAHDGAEAGTSGLAKRAEAIDVQVLPQGQVPAGYDASKAACVTK